VVSSVFDEAPIACSDFASALAAAMEHSSAIAIERLTFLAGTVSSIVCCKYFMAAS
jgi:hypothetical protein